MSNNAFADSSVMRLAAVPSSTPQLRIVGRGEARAGSQLAAVPALALASVRFDGSPAAFGGVLAQYFTCLGVGDRIEFVHVVEREPNAPACTYAMRVHIACRSEAEDVLERELAQALAVGCPAFHFVPVTTRAQVAGARAAVAYQYTPAGVVLSANPGAVKFGQQARLADLFEERAPGRERWPFPAPLANYSLTALLEEPLELPSYVELRVRIHGFALDKTRCNALYQSLLRVEAGTWHVFYPDSEIATYATAPELAEGAIALAKYWLRHPIGFAMDCVVTASHPLNALAQQRIIGDVFGRQPFRLVRAAQSPQDPLEEPAFDWACAAVQGVPAIMPGRQQALALGVSRHYSPPLIIPPTAGARFGATASGATSSRVALPYESRAQHVAIFGASGSGKSSLLARLIAEDINDRQRRCGIGLIDPHGDLYECVLRTIPASRAEDVVTVDLADAEHTACLNPLEGMRDDPMYAQFIVGEIMALIEALFETDDSTGPLTRSNLRHLLLLAASVPSRSGTFLDAVRVLEDSDYRDYLLSKCRDRNVIDYWRRFQRMSGQHGYDEWLPYLMARLTPFVSNPIMKRLVNRPVSTIDIAAAMREKKIVLFNLTKAVLQDIECQVLGSLILMKFFAAALARARTAPTERPPFHLYIDEFQAFATDSVPRMFSEARKYGLCLTTANQSLSQLGRSRHSGIVQAILANTATKLMFRLGPSDIEVLRPYYSPQLDAGDMANLPDFHAAACIAHNNRPVPPFVLQVMRVEAAMSNGSVESVLARARQRHAVPTQEANEELMNLYDLSWEALGRTDTVPNSRPTVA